MIGSHEAEVLPEDALQFEGLRITEGAGRAMGLQDVEGFRSVRGRPSLALRPQLTTVFGLLVLLLFEFGGSVVNKRVVILNRFIQMKL